MARTGAACLIAASIAWLSHETPATSAEPPPPLHPAPIPSADRNQPPAAQSGFQLHVALVYLRTFGNADETSAMSDFVGPGIGIQVGIGGRFTPHIYLGGYLGVGGGKGSPPACEFGPCSSSLAIAGIEARYMLKPAAAYDPWIGLGVGFDGASVHVGFDEKQEVALDGYDWVVLSTGVNLRRRHSWGFGFFVSGAVGQYTSRTMTDGNVTTKSDVADPQVHGWLTLGLRGVLFP